MENPTRTHPHLKHINILKTQQHTKGVSYTNNLIILVYIYTLIQMSVDMPAH